MEILGHHINTVKARTFYTLNMSSHRPQFGRHYWMPTLEYRKKEQALKAGLKWLADCDAEDTSAEFRLLRVKVYGDGSIRFFHESEWYGSRAYYVECEYGEAMIAQGLAMRAERMQELGVTV